ncbi:hypothetical protein GUJ93_ZPchr0001g30004 [Zizania palustris]|uniref:Uncharacterized protein n=1 Tax=Zizania palustris TaxID=103762 RepID=A0A8J5R4W1_ZIZPA|nr:hypothetical protein GUJ93_ZPchr0001g30004 [Zizania palustris]
MAAPGEALIDEDVVGSSDPRQHIAAPAPAHPPRASTAWADVLVSEMSAAVSADDARARAVAVVLGAFGGAVARAASAQNAVLKKAVLVQQRRRLAQEERQWELQLHASGM